MWKTKKNFFNFRCFDYILCKINKQERKKEKSFFLFHHSVFVCILKKTVKSCFLLKMCRKHFLDCVSYIMLNVRINTHSRIHVYMQNRNQN